MRFIPTKVHGIVDYLTGILLIAAPWLLNFDNNGPATWIPVLLGAGIILYSLLTDYELGAFKALPMPAHLWLDGLGGLFLAASPWIFNFDEYIAWPHVAVGAFEVVMSLITHTRPAYVALPDRAHERV
jgi:hypothetical protein